MIADLDLVMIHAIRCPAITSQLLKVGLTADHFNLNIHKHYEVIWGAISEYYIVYQELPGRLYLINLAGKKMETYSGLIEVLERNVKETIDTAYAIPEEELAYEKLIETGILQTVIDQLVLTPEISKLSAAQHVESEVASNAVVSLADVHERTRVTVNRRTNIFDPELRQQYLYPGPPDKTGVEWIDLATGGIYDGSLCGLLAESAGGKTMAGVQLLCSQAELGRCALAFYYEQGLSGDISTRIVSYAAGIPRSSTMKDYSNYTPDEKHAIDLVSDQMDKYLHLYDMSGHIKGQGNGCVQEIDNILRESINAGNNPKFVLIDWLGPMVMAAYNLPEHADAKDLRQKIDVTLSHLKRLTEKYGVTIMVLHQIAPSAIEGKTPMYKPEWTIAQECKHFGQLMYYVFCFGRKDPVNMCMWFNVPKARGTGNVARVVQMDPESNRINDVHELYVPNATPTPGMPYFIQKSRNRSFDDDDGI